MYLKNIELSGFKSFAKKETLGFSLSISGIVGPNGSGKSNIAEGFRFVLGEQSIKSMRGKRGEDLIFNGSPSTPRANRASVKVTFDNTNRFLDMDFDEVSIERTVFRDGINHYAVNGSQVRLKDIIELLARANIGATGHHIISQGEADRILNANNKERREIIEDALGLKIYQYKKQESRRKLEKTEENITQVESLRNEVIPHLKFLEKQVKKIERSLVMREELKVMYHEYLKREYEYIAHNTKRIEHDKKPLLSSRDALRNSLDTTKEIMERKGKGDEKSGEIAALEESIGHVRSEKEVLSRDCGRIEGQIAYEERRLNREKKSGEEGSDMLIKLSDVESVVGTIEASVTHAEKTDDQSSLKRILRTLLDTLKDFIQNKRKHRGAALSEDELATLKKEKEKLDAQLSDISQKEISLNRRYETLRKEIEAVKDQSRDAEREMFRLMQEQTVIETKLEKLNMLAERVRRDDEELKRELAEAGVLLGLDIAKYQSAELRDVSGALLTEEMILAEPRQKQEERRREIEKIKIRLEEAGGGGADEIMKEYKEVKERDEFFERELTDLHASSETLSHLISELEQKLDVKFKEGIEKINMAFQEFFSLLFDGGTASIVLFREEKTRKQKNELDDLGVEKEEPMEDEEEESSPEGVDINVNLPRKKIRGLDMLSGGERALTSIALLFAMSQVNPPPFIILDETDAALDESNSRKYGDMIENLSKKSQLILVTHNRETMSRAGILYGVTMGGDGISKILSVKLEEAVAVAK